MDLSSSALKVFSQAVLLFRALGIYIASRDIRHNGNVKQKYIPLVTVQHRLCIQLDTSYRRPDTLNNLAVSLA